MRFQIRVTRVQTFERSVRAVDEEHALERIRADLEKPYGLIAAWKDQSVELELIETSSEIGELSPVPQGQLMFDIKTASRILGIGRDKLYELMRAGEIESVRIGRRVLVSRQAIDKFIEVNTGRW